MNNIPISDIQIFEIPYRDSNVVSYKFSEDDTQCQISIDKAHQPVTCLKLLIRLSEIPIAFRNVDYTWVDTGKIRISDPLSPKILKFSSGYCLMAGSYKGTWIYDPESPNLLEWRIWGKELSPNFHYGMKVERIWHDPIMTMSENLELTLLYVQKPLELSRSKIPFSPCLLLTDHCDFDTSALLKAQREYFKKKGIKVTKGVFMFDYSKFEDNASFEHDKEEYLKWVEDGHELTYHALSQRDFKDPDKSAQLFDEVVSPVKGQFEIYIDHAFQPYNFSKQYTETARINYFEKLKKKNIKLLWNYFDVSEATWNLNQLNSKLHLKSRILTSGVSLLNKLRILLVYNPNEYIVARYRKMSDALRRRDILSMLKQIKVFAGFFNDVNLDDQIRRTQIIFKSRNHNIRFFQTIAVKNWVHTLGDPLDLLMKERGVAILHTYFAFLGQHHKHPMFSDKDGKITKEVDAAFQRLSQCIQDGQIWNPTLSEFIDHISELENIHIDCDKGIPVVGDKWKNSGLVRNVD